MTRWIHTVPALALLIAGALLGPGAWAQPVRPVDRRLPPGSLIQPRRPPFTALDPRRFRKLEHARVLVGPQENGIGIFPGREDEAPRGPSSFTVDEAGEIHILDSEKGRLVTITPGVRELKARPLEGARNFTVLTRVSRGELAAFDSRRNELVSFDVQGKIHERLKDLPRVPFTSIRRMADGQLALDSPRRTHVLSLPDRTATPPGASPRMRLLRRPVQPQAAGLVPMKSNLAARALRTGKKGLLRVQDTGTPGAPRRELSVEPPVEGRLGAVTVLHQDSAGRLFVRIEVITRTSPLEIRRFIRAYDSKMNPIDTFEYPVEGLIIGDQDVQVDDQGNVYVMLTYPDRVEVQRFSP